MNNDTLSETRYEMSNFTPNNVASMAIGVFNIKSRIIADQNKDCAYG